MISNKHFESYEDKLRLKPPWTKYQVLIPSPSPPFLEVTEAREEVAEPSGLVTFWPMQMAPVFQPQWAAPKTFREVALEACGPMTRPTSPRASCCQAHRDTCAQLEVAPKLLGFPK